MYASDHLILWQQIPNKVLETWNLNMKSQERTELVLRSTLNSERDMRIPKTGTLPTHPFNTHKQPSHSIYQHMSSSD